jgi:hypothetical protein
MLKTENCLLKAAGVKPAALRSVIHAQTSEQGKRFQLLLDPVNIYQAFGTIFESVKNQEWSALADDFRTFLLYDPRKSHVEMYPQRV